MVRIRWVLGVFQCALMLQVMDSDRYYYRNRMLRMMAKVMGSDKEFVVRRK